MSLTVDRESDGVAAAFLRRVRDPSSVQQTDDNAALLLLKRLADEGPIPLKSLMTGGKDAQRSLNALQRAGLLVFVGQKGSKRVAITEDGTELLALIEKESLAAQ